MKTIKSNQTISEQHRAKIKEDLQKGKIKIPTKGKIKPKAQPEQPYPVFQHRLNVKANLTDLSKLTSQDL